MDCKETQPVHPKGNQSCISIERTDAETETPVLWPPEVKGRLIGKDPDAGKHWKQCQTLFFWAPKSLQMVIAALKLKDLIDPWKKSYDQPRQHIKKQDTTLSTKVHLVKAMVFPVVMYGGESWTIKKAEPCRIDAFELTLENPLDCKETQPVHPKGNQS